MTLLVVVLYLPRTSRVPARCLPQCLLPVPPRARTQLPAQVKELLFKRDESNFASLLFDQHLSSSSRNNGNEVCCCNFEVVPRERAAVVVAVTINGDALVPELLVVPSVRPDHFATIIFNLLTKRKGPHKIFAETKKTLPEDDDSRFKTRETFTAQSSLFPFLSTFSALKRSQLKLLLSHPHSLGPSASASVSASLSLSVL